MSFLKKTGYKYQLQQALQNHNWEIIEIGQNEAWWDDEHWKIQHKHNQELICYISFIVDPQVENPRKKGQGIYRINASTEFPSNWNDKEKSICEIHMGKRKFNVKLHEFLATLSAYQKEKA